MSISQRNSISDAGITLILNSGFQCFVMSSRLILRTRSSTSVSLNGTNGAGS